MLGADVIEEPRAAFKRTMHSTQGRYYTTSHICIVIVSHRGWKARSFSIDTQGTAGMLLSHQPTVCCPVRVRSDFFKRLSHSVVDTGRADQWLRVAPTIYFVLCFSSLFFCAHRENYYICSILFDYFGSRFSLRESCTFVPLSFSLSRSVTRRRFDSISASPTSWRWTADWVISGILLLLCTTAASWRHYVMILFDLQLSCWSWWRHPLWPLGSTRRSLRW